MVFNVKLILFSIFLICQAVAIPLFSQTTDYIDGKIINSTTLEPVSFATIKLKNHRLGIYANADGDFRVIHSSEFQSDSLTITCIGFRRFSCAYSNLNSDSVNKISLVPVVYGLGEVKITSSGEKLNSPEIIAEAIKRIKNNYPERPFSYVSYYRDYQKRDKDYINLNEAIIETIDNGFASKSLSNKYRLLDFRKNTDFPRMNISPYYRSLESNYVNQTAKVISDTKLNDQNGNELFVLLVHDAIRNFDTTSFSFVETFSDNFLSNHNFAEPVPVYNNNLLLLKIVFNGKSRITGDSVLVSGAIYIQPKSFSIHKLEYTCFYKARGNGLKKMFNVDIEYGHENSPDSLMYLKYISFNNLFEVEDPDETHYFRIQDAYWDTNHYINPTIIINFNKQVDPVSAASKENYEITAGAKQIKINSIQVSGKTAYIRFKAEELGGKGDSCMVNIDNIKDTDGNVLFKRKSVELYQYRELFVQDYNRSLPFTDSCYIQYLPLEQNCIAKYSGKFNYWMNTPFFPQ
jgi:hypothetical protein